jgi:Ribbon-helix-helix protein, copG family
VLTELRHAAVQDDDEIAAGQDGWDLLDGQVGAEPLSGRLLVQGQDSLPDETLKRGNVVTSRATMPMRRITVYLEPDLHQALKLQAAETRRNVSDLINEAVRRALARDLEDLDTFAARAAEPAYSFELVLRNLHRTGGI